MAGVVLENVSRVYPASARNVDGASGKSAGRRSGAAVENVSLEVVDREFLVLVGPSGCGKTTTLRMIAGLEELSAGTIKIGNRVVNDVPPKDRDIAMVFQNYALYPHLSVYRNLAFGLELRERLSRWDWLWRWSLTEGRRATLAHRRYEVASRVRETARTLGIEDLLERLPGELSGGERQRVALGRAIVRKPAVFLFDEPLSNLDAKLRVEMRRELKQLHERLQTTMIYVTHDQVEALTLGDRIVVMNEGTIQQVGRPMDLYDGPANRFVAGFIGTPAMNFWEGTLSASGNQVEFRRGDWKVDLPQNRLQLELAGERSVVLGIRPEDVKIEAASGNHGVRGDGVVGTVRMIEMLGDATIATVAVASSEGQTHTADGVSVVSKIDPRRAVRPGERVSVKLDASRAHVFDGVGGERL